MEVVLVLCTQGAFWGLMVGLAVGLTRMVLEFVFPPPRCGVFDPAPSVLRSVHYLHFAIILCALTAIVVVVISLLTPPPTEEQVIASLRKCFQRFKKRRISNKYYRNIYNSCSSLFEF